MSEWYENQKKTSSNWRKKLADLIASKKWELQQLITEEQQGLSKSEAIPAQLRGEKNVQLRQLKRWFTEEQYGQIETEWQLQKEIRNELKDEMV